MSDPYLGEIRMVGFTFAPYGWALCAGQQVPISQNQALFSLLGTTYGGNGTTTFQLPDLQGRSPVGVGNGAGLTPIVAGQISGTENVSVLVSNMPSHTHVATVAGGGAGSPLSIPVAIPATITSTGEGAVPGTGTTLGPIAAGGRPGSLYSTNPPDTTLKPFNVTATIAATTVTNASIGNGLPLAIRNPYLGLTCIIALQGVFPTRG
ncbi:tail fiber protein [Paraburkholderia jirisanensis]